MKNCSRRLAAAMTFSTVFAANPATADTIKVASVITANFGPDLSLLIKAAKDPVRVAFAMENVKIKGLNGDMEMRKSDHQLQQPLYIGTWTKVNGRDVRYEQENTGYGWKTIQKIDAFVATQPTSCQMKRPNL